MNTNRWWLVVGAAILSSGPLAARTVTLTADDCDLMAVISADAPRVSWATPLGNSAWNTHTQTTMTDRMAVLLRFPLDKIPKKQRIIKAEWTAPYGYTPGVQQRLSVRRLIGDWGIGVCHDYRMVYPKKIEAPGGRGPSSDRAAKTSAVFVMKNSGEATVDVTEDIDLWYTGAASNRGWMLTLDDPGALVYLTAPYPGGAGWKLQITYEPE